jgi:hypothetical protein
VNARRMVPPVLVLLLALVGLPAATGAQEAPPQPAASPEAIPALIFPLFSYQGRLVEGGVPVTGNREMTFRLWTSSSLGAKVWEQGPEKVAVSNGLFTATLGDATVLPVDWFSYELWLEVQVGATTLPRQRLVGAPYAMSLAPGAQVLGSKPVGEPAVVTVENASTGTALYAASDGSQPTLQVANTSNTGEAAQLDSNGSYYTAMVVNSYPGASNTGGVLRLMTNGGRVILAQNKSFTQLFTVEANGDVTQSNSAGGLVKVAIYANCDNTLPAITRHYSHTYVPTITGGPTPGTCTIDPGIDISTRYWTVTAPPYKNDMRLASCGDCGGNLCCLLTNTGGTGIDGDIIVLIY